MELEMNNLTVSEEGNKIPVLDWTVNKAAICRVYVVTATIIAWPRGRLAPGKKRVLDKKKKSRVAVSIYAHSHRAVVPKAQSADPGAPLIHFCNGHYKVYLLF